MHKYISRYLPCWLFSANMTFIDGSGLSSVVSHPFFVRTFMNYRLSASLPSVCKATQVLKCSYYWVGSCTARWKGFWSYLVREKNNLLHLKEGSIKGCFIIYYMIKCVHSVMAKIFFSRVWKGEKNNKHTINNKTQPISIDYCKQPF